MKRKKFEKRIRLLKKKKDISLNVNGEIFDFQYDSLEEELFLIRDNKYYRLANWQDVFYSIVTNLTHLKVYVLNPDENVKSVVFLDYFTMIDRPW